MSEWAPKKLQSEAKHKHIADIIPCRAGGNSDGEKAGVIPETTVSGLDWEICLGIGGNVGDIEDNIIKALKKIIHCFHERFGFELKGVSGVYLTSPVGNPEQPNFLNCAALFGPAAKPEQFKSQSPAGKQTVIERDSFLLDILAFIKKIEVEIGRKVETKRNRPREIDIDIIFTFDRAGTGNINIDYPSLKLPHPEMANRKFVLFPLADLAPRFSPDNPFRESYIKKALESLEMSDAGACQQISAYGTFDAEIVSILKKI